MEEGQRQSQRAHFPEQMRQYCQGHGKDKAEDAWLAELLWNCRHEEQHRETERLAVSPYSYVHLEAMEKAGNEKTQTVRTWC